MHIHHAPVHRWFAARGRDGWATCPITENGFVRVASHPRYPNRPGDAAAVLAILRQFCAGDGHHFWGDDISLREVLRPGAAITHSQITDAFLLGLAVRHGGRLATLDRRIPTALIEGGGDALELIAP
jgi:predicted nucleic acid-binding protein